MASKNLTLFELLSVFGLFLSVLVAIHAIDVSKDVYEKNLPYQIPRDPTLRFWIDRSLVDSPHSIPSFPLFQIAGINGSDITIYVFNDGRGVSGNIRFYWDMEDFAKNGENLKYLDGGNGSFKITKIKALCKGNFSYYETCTNDENRKQIILGPRNISLKYECDFCNERERLNNMNFTICIYNENKTKDCPNS